MKWPRRISPAGTRVSFRDFIATLFGVVIQPNPRTRLTDEVKRHFGVTNAFLTNSGRSALVVILKAIFEGDTRNEILIPAYTCFSVPSAIKKAGLKIRLIDLREETLDYDFNQLEKAITSKTLAILLVYPFGLGCDIRRAQKIARDHGIYLIEDAAQSMGLKISGQFAGTIGDVGLFSLSKGKPITSMRGGIIVTKDEKLAQKIAGQMEGLPRAGWAQSLRVLIEAKVIWFFLRPGLFWVIGKLPFVKLGETHYEPMMKVTQMPRAAAILCRRMLPRLDAINEARAKTSMVYLDRMSKSPNLSPITGCEPETSRFLRLPVLCANHAAREKLADELVDWGASRMYRESLAAIDDPDLFAAGQLPAGSFPGATKIAQCLLTLPTHVYVTEKDIDGILQKIQTLTPNPRSSSHVSH